MGGCVDMLHTRILGSKVYIDLEIQANGDKSHLARALSL